MPTPSLEAIKAVGKFDPTLDLLIDIFEELEKPEDAPHCCRKLAARDGFQRGRDGNLSRRPYLLVLCHERRRQSAAHYIPASESKIV
jgi:hypothetical protein